MASNSKGKVPKEALGARRRVFRSRSFSNAVAESLELDQSLIANAIDAMIEVEILPNALSTNVMSLPADGAAILLAIGSQQLIGTSIAEVAVAFSCMSLQAELGGLMPPLGTADVFPRKQSISFGTDVAQLLYNFWKAAHLGSASGYVGVAVSMLWIDQDGGVLFGFVEQPLGKRKRVNATEPFRIPSAVKNEWDFVQLPTRAQIKFPRRSILRFAAMLDACVADTPAEF